MNSKSGESNCIGKVTTSVITQNAVYPKGHKYRGDTTHGEVWTLSRRWTDNISNLKTQQVFHTKSVFGELGLVMKITTSTKTQQGENPNKNQER